MALFKFLRSPKQTLPECNEEQAKRFLPQGGAIRLGGGDASIVVDPRSGKLTIKAAQLDIQCSGPLTINGIGVDLSNLLSIPKTTKTTDPKMTTHEIQENNRAEGKPGAYVGDLQKTAMIDGLFRSTGERDAAWRKQVLENVADASFACGDPQVMEGPDGLPYFVLKTPEPGTHFQCFVLRHLLDHLLEHGLGVAFNPEGQSVDLIFTYGQILNFHIKGEFHTQQPNESENQQMIVSSPSMALLPDSVRGVLRQVFESWGIDNVNVALATHMPSGNRELVFVVDQSLLSQKQRLQALMQHLNWYTPSCLVFNLTGSAHPSFRDATPL